MKRKIAAILTAFMMMLNLLPLSGCGKSEDESGGVTRGEWILMLAQAFGMDSYADATPHYTDVSSSSTLFPYVQSSFEWNVLLIFADEKLDPDKEVTREEVGSTAAIAVGCPVTDKQFDSKGRFNSDATIEYAVQNGILDNDKQLSRSMTLDECETVISAARIAYLSQPLAEKSVVDTNDDLIDLTGLNADQLVEEDGYLTIPAGYSVGVSGSKAAVNTRDGIVEVGVGDVFITAPTVENPSGVAYKVSSVEEIDGEIVFATEEPTLYDLYDELDVSTTVSVDSSNIIWLLGDSGSSGAQGVVSQQDGAFHVSFLSYQADEARIIPLGEKTYSYGGFSDHFEIGSGSFEKNWSNHSSSVIGSGEGAQALAKSNFIYDDTPSIEDFGGTTDSWSKGLEIDNSFSGGYKITGDISINALTVATSVEYNKLWGIPYGVKSASVQVNSDISSTLALEGNLSERLHIATIPVPIAATGLSVRVDLYLYADASGSLVVTASLGSSAKVEYSNEKLKHTASSQASADVDANMQVDFGAELAATLEALSIVKIVDVGAKAGGTLTASASVSGACKASEENGVAKLTYQESLKIQAELYVPTVNLYAGGSGTLIAKLGLSGSWDIMTKEKGAKHLTLADYEWVFWEETVLTNEDGDITESEQSTAGDEDGIGASDEEYLDLKTYVLTLTGDPIRLELDLNDGEAAPDVAWTSDDTGIASVDSTGLVTPVSTGYTIITVSLRSDPSIYVKCAVYVEEIGENNWEFLPADLSVVI